MLLTGLALGGLRLAQAPPFAPTTSGQSGGVAASGHRVVLASNIVIPIRHTGQYRWRSSGVRLSQPMHTFAASYRPHGDVRVVAFNARPVQRGNKTLVVVTFKVQRFSGPASVQIISAHVQT
jgi:hypothetical protein